MRLIIAALLLSVGMAHAAPPKADDFAPVLELAGLRLLCEQSAPLVQRGMNPAQQAQLGRAFAADGLCRDLAEQLAGKFDRDQLEQARQLLDSPLARRFTAAERAVGEGDGTALADYREQLAARPPRQDRLALVRRLDAAARTTALATVLRYEAGKTQALLALKARGETLDEQALSSQTQVQVAALKTSSAAAVESFMLYAYRQIPSEQLADYAALYEHPAVSHLLESSVQVLPQLFAARRAAFR
ncbi:hypothetical protein LPB260_21085 [Pseudomonas sp. LPB0260]|uniref:hypothetical protein n=1 Tax=Pseudomonas sp. LPB0260 TaxID=2614442 RepID=UPI0015C1C7C7|nr:hypothetical protein [Pseudomonas sp. LPB0260]QLC73244.1 hypothetical protein LPB260_06135 [Pseudomonas sp. LPB0260]QLC76018.1 hypothetical protein LPB260_21085 [Pseudomonas sp. LPB0260]